MTPVVGFRDLFPLRHNCDYSKLVLIVVSKRTRLEGSCGNAHSVENFILPKPPKIAKVGRALVQGIQLDCGPRVFENDSLILVLVIHLDSSIRVVDSWVEVAVYSF